VTYGFEWIPGPVILAIVLLPLVVPSFALIGLVVMALAVVAALVVLAGTIFAMPYLLVRSLRRRVSERASKRRLRTARQPSSTGRRGRVPALGEPALARRAKQ
jgi:membrane protein implicated in regulation of membrane protease activity